MMRAKNNQESQEADAISKTLIEIKNLLLEMQKVSPDDENPSAKMHQVFEQTIDKIVSIEALIVGHHGTMIELVTSQNAMREELSAIYRQNRQIAEFLMQKLGR